MIRRALTPLTKLFKDKTEATIFFSAFLIEIAFGLYLIQRWGHTLVDPDGFCHLYIPRTVVNNAEHNNFANLGTRMLPMFRLLVMPLVLIDPLYTTGFAGTIVNALATGGICVILYRLIGDKRLGILASALYMCNAFTLIYGATPMMEQTAIFFMVLAAYYFKRYWKTDSITEFMKCSIALILGTLTRYEVWAGVLLVIFFFVLRELKNGQGYRLAYAHLPLWGIFAWLFWNLAIWRDPLTFLWLYPWTEHWVKPPSLGLIINWFTQQAFITSGVLSLVAALSMIVLIIQKKTSQIVVATLLLSPLFFLFAVFAFGYSTIDIAWARYYYLGFSGVVMLPLMLLFQGGDNPTNVKGSHFKGLLRIVIVFILLILCLSPAYLVQTDFLASGQFRGAFLPQLHVDEIRKVKGVVGDRPLLLSAFTGADKYSVVTSTPPYLIIDDHDGAFYVEVMQKPWEYCQFVAISKGKPVAGIKKINDYYGGKFHVYRYYNDEAWRSKFLEHYELVLETGGLLVFERVV